MPLDFYRGNFVSPEFLTALASAFKAGAAKGGVSVSDPDREIVDALQWAGVSTVESAFDLGDTWATFHSPPPAPQLAPLPAEEAPVEAPPAEAPPA